jgi:hypothetical protein
MDVFVNKLGSITRNIPLPHKVLLSDDISATPGAVLAVEVLLEKHVYNQLELTTGRFATIMKGDLLAVALGARRALKGFVGDVPASVKVGDVIHLLNMGGVAGICTSGSTLEVGEPLPIKVLGSILYRGKPAHIRDFAKVEWADTLEVDVPLILVSGTCMNVGKTATVCELIKQLTAHGQRVAAGKLTGVSLARDSANMADHGAICAYDFTDAGLPSTTDPAVAAPVAKGILNALNRSRPDVIVMEMGDGLLGGYGVREILEDAQIRAATTVHLLCAHDPVGAQGGTEIARSFGLPIDCISGPATDNSVGTDFVRDALGLRTANARRDGKRLYQLVREIMLEKLTATPASAEGDDLEVGEGAEV